MTVGHPPGAPGHTRQRPSARRWRSARRV